MIRSLLSTVLVLGLVTVSFAAEFAGDETRVLRTAEDKVVSSITVRGNQPRVSGSAMIDATHAQVDVFFVNSSDMIVPNSTERFVYDLTTGLVSSLGAPVGEVAVLRDVLTRVKSDALSRFERAHPGTGPTPDGVNAEVKSTDKDAQGNVHVTCESFGGIAGMWFGDAITYTYNADGAYLSEARH